MELFKPLGFSGASLAKLLSKEPRVLESDAYTVIEFFRAHGFSDEQISTLTMKRPILYMLDRQKIMKPKLEFFKSLGFSYLEIASRLSAEPYILGRSLENQIIPCVQKLRQILGTDDNVLKAVRACFSLIEFNVETVLQANISILLSHGVPNSLVVKIFFMQPRSLLMRTYRFSEIVNEVMKLGFDPNNLLFVLAIRSMAIKSKALWEKKVEAFRSFGLSKDEIYSAFKLQPMCMDTSEKKIMKVMGFFVNNLKMKPSIISKNPNLLLLSLEKRIIPRQMKKLEDDVYTFRFILLEAVVGSSVCTRRESFLLNEMAYMKCWDGQKRIIDPILLASCSQESLSIVISIMNRCISLESCSHPSIEDCPLEFVVCRPNSGKLQKQLMVYKD